MKYKIGDKVKVRKDLEKDLFYGKARFDEEQEEFKGKSAIIKFVYRNSCKYDLDIDDGEFFWTDEMLEPIAKSIAKSAENTDKVSTNSVESIDNFSLKDLKFGDIVTLRNGEQGITSGEKIVYSNEKFDFTKEFNTKFNYLGNNKPFDIMKIERYIHYSQYGDTIYTLTTIYERKEEILDEEEKEWLKNLLKPLHSTTISNITKTKQDDEERIRIGYATKVQFRTFYSFFELPPFSKDTMYKGMEINKKYTLKELGI